jgi:hypothetical protein
MAGEPAIPRIVAPLEHAHVANSFDDHGVVPAIFVALIGNHKVTSGNLVPVLRPAAGIAFAAWRGAARRGESAPELCTGR